MNRNLSVSGEDLVPEPARQVEAREGRSGGRGPFGGRRRQVGLHEDRRAHPGARKQVRRAHAAPPAGKAERCQIGAGVVAGVFAALGVRPAASPVRPAPPYDASLTPAFVDARHDSRRPISDSRSVAAAT